ncbi:Prenylcysteine lyase-domain-containing protein [Gigaspora rosea]|uniref:Prenylcysteine lyase-domain-containing protein n=1 Tax=Gigaspora rosea TaxID=44941 RepID=A0A397UHQ5_9GLOM|nr:Prenylcysteine lyase-domain-containing protein [Gigaspora rosea]
MAFLKHFVSIRIFRSGMFFCLIILLFCVNLFSTQNVAYFEIPHQKDPKTIAIIGAGAGGSSAAYWISEAFANSSTSVKTTVYEQLPQVGGRALVYNYTRDNTQIFIELGASLFIDVNYHMTNSAKKFGLEFINYGEELPNAKVGIWDGNQFVFEQSSSSYWDISKLIWKYGWAPIKVQRLVKFIISKYLKTYEFKEPFTSVNLEAERLQLDLERKFTAQYYFSELKNINQLYLQHLVEPMSRVNYGQNLGEIHALGAFISLAPTGAKSIKGGNYRLFEKFIEHSGATLKLDTKVIKVTKLQTINGVEESVKYKKFSGIEFENIYLEMKEIPYVTLHVTFVTGRLNPSYFNRTKVEDFPNQILTTNSGKTEFLSLAAKIILENGETLNKIFSHDEMSDEVLDRIFSERSWTFRKVWKSYPMLMPNQTFPPIEPDTNFYYVNSYEPLISTMETECVSSNNIAKLLANRWISINL